MTNQTSDKGLVGERQALAYLQQLGMRPVCQRYRCPYGEIDLVMLDGECLVFVEVKLRARGRNNVGVSAVEIVIDAVLWLITQTLLTRKLNLP